jgi:hypothetical protein
LVHRTVDENPRFRKLRGEKLSFTIIFLGPEIYQKDGSSWTKYRYQAQDLLLPPSPKPITQDFLNARMVAAIGSHEIEFHAKEGNRALPTHYGGKQNHLDTFWFELPSETVPPSFVYLRVKFQSSPNEAKSNFAETTQ